MEKVIITGGAGFVGHHFVEHFLKNTNWKIVVLDRLTYAGRLSRLKDIGALDNDRVLVLTVDFSKRISEGVLRELLDSTIIFHLGAESHVDRSIADPVPFAESNVVGTTRLLTLTSAMRNLKSFYYFSTDEVFGPAPKNVNFNENAKYNPTNPYAASKAGAELMCKACRHTWKLPVVIVRSMNIFGERQHPEKFIPKVIRYTLEGKTIPIHASKQKVPGSRFYIHARNVADALLFLVRKGIISGDYNICGEREIDNLTLAKMIAKVVGKSLKYELVDFHSSRPGHDLRYALDDSRIRALGWKQPKTIEKSLVKTIKWTLNRKEWIYYD